MGEELCHLVTAWQGWKSRLSGWPLLLRTCLGLQVFQRSLAEVGWLLAKYFLSYEAAPVLILWVQKASFGLVVCFFVFCLCRLVGIFRLPASPALSLGYMRQKEKPRELITKSSPWTQAPNWSVFFSSSFISILCLGILAAFSGRNREKYIYSIILEAEVSIPQLFICCIFIQFNVLFLWRRLLWPVDYLEMCYLVSSCLEIFLLCFCYWCLVAEILILLWSENILCTISIILNLLKLVLEPKTWSLLVYVLWALGKKVYSVLTGWRVL